MAQSKKFSLAMRCKAIAMLAVYLFVTLSFVFLLGRLVPSDTADTGAKFKAAHSQNDVQRQDKAILKSNDNLRSYSLPAVIACLHFAFNKANVTEFPIATDNFRTVSNSRFSYLSLRQLRI